MAVEKERKRCGFVIWGYLFLSKRYIKEKGVGPLWDYPLIFFFSNHARLIYRPLMYCVISQ